MKLLFQSTMRHMRQHFLQTILTLAVTILITAILSAIFHFASSFQNLLREYALDTTGDYHYKYVAPEGSDTADMLCRMAKAFQEDTWFSDVVLTKDEYGTSLFLTVASPGIFTSKRMESKFNEFKDNYFWDDHSIFQIGSFHNYELLASYGDLNKQNGIYSYLLVFFLMIIVISFSSILILGSVFQVSASQRERDFALLMSIGASRSQIRNIVLLESIFYICLALPVGFFLGIIFFHLSKSHVDDLLYSLEKFPPIKLTISVWFSAALILCAVCVILLSGFIPATKAAKISPIEMIQKTRDIYARNKDRAFKKILGVEEWLAFKSHKRFKRRCRPILLVLSVTFMLCLVLTGFCDFSTEVSEMWQSRQSYNIRLDLYSDNAEKLNELANNLIISSEYELCPIREARFELHSPYPFSEAGFAAKNASSAGILPDILLISVDDDTYHAICQNLQIEPDFSGSVNGIFIRGNYYSIEKGDTVTAYQSADSSAQEEGIDIIIVEVLDEAPLYIDTDNSMRMLVLVSESDFIQLDTLRPFSEYDPGLYHISLRGLSDDVHEIEKAVEKYAYTQSDVIINTANYQKYLQQENASIAGFQYLCTALISMFTFVCICGNFTVSWTIHHARQKEYAMLMSIGMQPWELQKMKYWELLFNMIYSFAFGILTGMICHWIIFKLYSTEYQISWNFPWDGLLLGLLVLCVSIFFTELALKITSGKFTMADMFRRI